MGNFPHGIVSSAAGINKSLSNRRHKGTKISSCIEVIQVRLEPIIQWWLTRCYCIHTSEDMNPQGMNACVNTHVWTVLVAEKHTRVCGCLIIITRDANPKFSCRVIPINVRVHNVHTILCWRQCQTQPIRVCIDNLL